VYYAADSRALVQLRLEHRLRRRARLGGRWLDRDALHAAAGIDAPGAILTDGNAQTDPYRACLAVRAPRATPERRSMRRRRSAGSAATAAACASRLRNGASIRAGYAVVATGYATPAFERLSGRFRMMNTYVVATRQLTRSERRRLGLGDVMLWDTRRPYHYVRWTRDGRLLIGGRDRPAVHDARRRSALRRRASELIDDLVTLYPSLRGIRADYAWEGLFATTPDGLPYIGPHRQHPRQLFALGYGGNGMTLGFFAAQAVVRMTQGLATADDELFAFGRVPHWRDHRAPPHARAR
jgi:glycine/D-amino acid oxidase-like deaminating enzyme